MKIRRLQAWIAEQLFSQPVKLATGAALVVAVSSTDIHAQSWAPAGSANWNATTSWTGGVVPASATSTALTFGGSTVYTATNDIGAFTLNKITVNNTAGITIDGGLGLTFAGTSPSITIGATAGATTITGPITYSVATAIANSSANLLTLNGAQTIGQNLTFSGSGATTISGGMTYTAARTITNNSTGLLTLGGAQTLTGIPTFTGTGNTTISGNIGAGSIVKSGAGTLTLSGANGMSGATAVTLNAGVLAVGAANTLGASGNTVVINGGTLRFTAAYNSTSTTAPNFTHILSFGASATGTLEVNSGITATVLGSQLIGTTATVNKTGAGILSVGSGGTSNVGTINVNAGTLQVTSNRLASVGTINVASGAQFRVSDDTTGSFPLAGAGYVFNGMGPSNAGALQLSNSGGVAVSTFPSAISLQSDSLISPVNGSGVNTSTITLSGAVTGAGNLIKGSTGLVILSNAGNTYGGATSTTTVRNGGIRISGGDNRLPIATSVILGDSAANTSGFFDLNGLSQTIAGLSTAGTGTTNRVVSTNTSTTGTLNVNVATGSQTFAGFLGGSITFGGVTSPGNTFNFAKSGAGNLTLSGTNTYTGTTAVNEGTLTISNAAALSSSSGSVTIASGAVLDLSAVSGGYNFGASQTLTAGRTTAAANDIVGSIGVAGTFNVGGSNTVATTTISGNGGFNAATLQFDLNNIAASGNDHVTVGGNLSFTGTNALNISKLNGPLSNGNYTLFTYTGSLTGDASNFNVTGAAGGRQSAAIDTISTPGSVLLAITGSAANLTWAGNVGSNVWDLTTTANFSGAANNDNRFYDGDTVTFNASGVGGTTPVLLAGALAPASLTVTGTQDYTFNDGGSGSIAGAGPITINGSGTLTLGVPVTTTGTTTITAGTLDIATGGSIAGPVSLTGGTLNTTNGNIAGSVSVTGGTLNANGGSITGPATVAGGIVNGNASNAFTGNVTINSGTVNGTVDGAFTGTVAITGGTFFATNPTGSAISSTPIAVSGTGKLQIGNGGNAGNINGTVALSSGGTLAFDRSNDASFSTAITGTGNIANNGTGEVTLTTAIPSGNYNFTGSGKVILDGNITGTTSITQSGTGTTKLATTLSNTQTGAINITGGTLEVGVGTTTGGAAAVVTINGGTYFATVGQTNTQAFNIGPNGGTIKVNPGFVFVKQTNGIAGVGNTLTITGGGTVALQSSGDSSISNVIVENGIYRHTSARYVTAATVPYTIDVKSGGTLFNLDTTSFGGANYFPFDNITGAGAAGSKITFNGDGAIGGGGVDTTTMFGAYLHVLGEASTTATNAATSSIKVPVILAGNSRFTLVNGDGRPATDRIVDSLIGGVSGPGGLIVDGDGNGTIAITTVAATYQGPTRVANGTLRIGMNDALPTGTTLTLGGTTGDNVVDSSGTFELNGKSQTVAGLGTLGNGNSNRIGNSTVADGALIVNYNGTSSQTFSGAIGYSDINSVSFRNLSLTKNGTGTLVLSGTNDYTLATNVNAGTLAIATAASLPSNTAPVNVASGAVLDVSGVAGGYSFIAGRTLTLGRTTAPANDLVGSAAIDGTLNIGGTNTVATATISGDLTLNNATLNFDLSNTFLTGNDHVNVGGNLNATGLTMIMVNQTAGSLGQGNYTLFNYSGALSGDASNFSLSGVVSSGTRAAYTIDTTTTTGAVLLNVSGAAANLTWAGNAGNNVWDLSTTANFTGATGAVPDNRFYNSDNITFDATGIGNATPVSVTGALSPASVAVSGTQDYTFNGSGSINAGTLIKDGSATLTLNVPFTSTSTTVNAGTLAIGTGGSVAGPVTVAGGTITGSTSGSVTGPVTVTSGIVNGSADGAFSGNLTVSGGTVNATVDNAFTGSVSITSGTFNALNPTGSAINNASITVSGTGLLQIGNGGIDGNLNGTIALAAGGTLGFNRSDAVTFANALTISGNSSIKNDGAGVVTRSAVTAVGANTLTLGGTGDLTFNATVSGTGQIVKNDTGTVTLLANNNTFTGTVTINAGTLILNDLGGGGDLSASSIVINPAGKFIFGADGNSDFPNSTFITINGGEAEFKLGENYGATKLINNGTLRLTGNGVDGGSGITSAATTGAFLGFALESGSIISTNAGTGNNPMNGAAAIPMTKTTSGTVSFTGPISYAAAMPINLQEGVMDFQAANIPANAGAGVVTLGGATTSGTLRYSDSANGTSARTFAVANGGGNIEVSSATSTLTMTGAVTSAGTGELTKSGAGTLTLSGTNTYTGTTTVSAGKLLINGNSSAATGNVNVSATATIGGSGTVGGLTTLASTATLSPGNSPGSLTFASGLNLSAGSNFQWELSDNSNSGVGSISDQVHVTGGALTLGSTVNFVPTFIGQATNPTNGGFWATSHTWSNVFDVSGTGTFSAGTATNFVIDNSAWASIGSFSTQAAATGSGVDLVWTSNTVVPTNPVLTAAVTSGSATFGDVLRNGTVASAGITLTNTGGASTDITANDINGFTVAPASPQNTTTTATSTVSLNTNSNGTFSGNLVYTGNPGSATTSAIAVSGTVGNASFDGTNSSTTFGPALSTTVNAGQVLTNVNLSSNSIEATATGGGPLKVGTTATIVNYSNTEAGNSSETVSMQWRTRTATEADLVNNPKALLSDVVRITGMGATNADVGTFLLTMTYDLDQTQFNGLNETSIALSGELKLAWLNGSNQWVNAVDGNHGGTAHFAGIGAPTGSEALGTWGIDTSGVGGTGYVWAVLNHNSDFAVIPEPSTLVLGGLALLGFAGVGLRRRRLAAK